MLKKKQGIFDVLRMLLFVKILAQINNDIKSDKAQMLSM